jgi:hypothetical protein
MSKKAFTKNAFKILRHTKERCPDCDANGLVLILCKEKKDGIEYSKKYLYCSVCEFQKEWKEKGKNKKFSEEDGGDSDDRHNERPTTNRNNGHGYDRNHK